MSGTELHLCHTSCLLLDAGTFTSYLTSVKTWMDANPNEVVTLLLVNTDGILPAVWQAAYVSAGIDTYAYTPTSVPIAYSDWPTLQTMITSGKRLVSFLAQNADVSSAPYLLDEFTNIWETPYDETDNSFPCNVDRVTGTSANKMVRLPTSTPFRCYSLISFPVQYLVNHFLDVNVTLGATVFPSPATQLLNTTNALGPGTGTLLEQSNNCYSLHQQLPTFTLVDYYDMGQGSVFEYAAKMNGVSYVAGTIGTANSTTSASGSGSSGTSSTSSSSLSPATSLQVPTGFAAWTASLLLGVGATAFML
ncbi:hypothetical protein P7C70_g118, partial [Phenoliferia sp. Uapishka_3]